MCLGISFKITFNFSFLTGFSLWRASAQHGTTLAELFPVEAVWFSQIFFISTLIPWLETPWASKSRCLSTCIQGLARITKRVLGCRDSSLPLTDMALWFCCQTSLWWPCRCWRIGQWFLAGKDYRIFLPTPRVAHRIPLPACASAVPAAAAELLCGLLHSFHRKLSISPLNYDDLTVVAWNGWTSSSVRMEGESVSFKRGTRPSIFRVSTWDVDTNSYGHIWTFNLHTHISSQ